MIGGKVKNNFQSKIMKLSIFFSSIIIVLGFIELGYRWYGQKNSSFQDKFTLYILGGSVAYGESYGGKLNFSRAIKSKLKGKINSKTIEILNFSSPGKGLKESEFQIFEPIPNMTICSVLVFPIFRT